MGPKPFRTNKPVQNQSRINWVKLGLRFFWQEPKPSPSLSQERKPGQSTDLDGAAAVLL